MSRGNKISFYIDQGKLMEIYYLNLSQTYNILLISLFQTNLLLLLLLLVECIVKIVYF